MTSTPLQLPASVSIKVKSKSGLSDTRIEGIFHYADDESGQAGKHRITGPDGKPTKCVYLFEFPSHEGTCSRFFLRPTSAEQYVKKASTGKGWALIDANLADSKGDRVYVSLQKIKDTVGFKNSPDFSYAERDIMCGKAKSSHVRRRRTSRMGVDIGIMASAMIEAGIYISNAKWTLLKTKLLK